MSRRGNPWLLGASGFDMLSAQEQADFKARQAEAVATWQAVRHLWRVTPSPKVSSPAARWRLPAAAALPLLRPARPAECGPLAYWAARQPKGASPPPAAPAANRQATTGGPVEFWAAQAAANRASR